MKKDQIKEKIKEGENNNQKIVEKKIDNKNMWKTLIHFTTKSVVKFWFLWLVFCFIWYLFFQSLNVVYMILTALIISVSMEWIIIAFENKVKQRWVAIAITYFLLVLFLLSWIIFIVPFIISQIAHLIEWISWITVSLKDFVMNNSWPEAIREVGWLPVFAQEYLIEHWNELNLDGSWFQTAILSSLNTLLDSSVVYLKQVSTWVFSFVWWLFSILWQLAIIFTLSIFFSIEKDYLIYLLSKCFSDKKQYAVQQKIDRIYDQLSIWLKARLLLSLFLAVMIWICLWILNLCWIEIPSVFSLALITWLLDIIPYIWPLLAAIPIAMLAFVHNWFWAMILVWVLFVLIQWVQENVFTPIVMWKQLWVNSVLILVCALLWAVILWFWWIVLSVPLAVILGLFIDDRWE